MTPAVDLDDVRAALTVTDVLRWAGIEVTDRGRGDLYGHQCPREYHRQSLRAFTMNRETGMWTCYACPPVDTRPFGGDLLRLIAECQNLTTAGEDFSRVLAIAAEIAGVTAAPISAEERTRRQRDREAREAKQRQERAEEQRRLLTTSIEQAGPYWNQLSGHHPPAQQWLTERGVSPAIDMGLVRFDLSDNGSIAMPLYADDGQIVNVIRRRLPAFAPTKDDRFRPISGLFAKGTYVNSISDVEPGRDLVLSEGFFDAITAAIAFRPAMAIGARSASDLATITRAVAPKIKDSGARLLIVPHRDNGGFSGALAACEEALAAGLRIRAGTLVIIDCNSPDLNDAWRGGWLPDLRRHP
jgi:hypothetical protein